MSKNMTAPTQECIIDSSGLHYCPDCGKEDPKWIYERPGFKVCPECSGVHRSLRTETLDLAQLMEEAEPSPTVELPSSSDDVVPSTYDIQLQKPYIEVEVCGFATADEFDEDYDPSRPRTPLDDAFDEMYASTWKCKLPIDNAFYKKFMAIPDKKRLEFINHYYNINNFD